MALNIIAKSVVVYIEIKRRGVEFLQVGEGSIALEGDVGEWWKEALINRDTTKDDM